MLIINIILYYDEFGLDYDKIMIRLTINCLTHYSIMLHLIINNFIYYIYVLI